MRKVLLTVWLIAPLGAGAYHFGPGQERLLLDDANARIDAADAHAARARELAAAQGDLAAEPEWASAKAAYAEALALLPADEVATRRRVRVEHAKCRMLVSELPEANAELADLVREMADDPDAEPEVLRDARAAYASSEYYMTWLMRLEGAGRETWEPRIESARQTYKLLAEEAEAAGEEHPLLVAREDLEAAIRLERMELTELQGLPLPSQ